MLQIISPKGKLMQIDTAVPVCERLVRFNGRRRLLQERAQNLETANAIALDMTQERSTPFASMSMELVVGNLPAGKAEEILKALLTQGYYDFTAFDYQKAKNISEVTFDQGKSNPYTTEDMVGVMMGGCQLFCSGNPVSMALNAVDVDNPFGSWCNNSVPASEAEDQDVDMWDEDEGLDEEEGLDE